MAVIISKDYAAFVIIRGMNGVPLVIEKKNFPKKMWKLPGGKPLPEDGMDISITAIREVNEKIGVIVKYPREVLRISKARHDFIVLEASYFSGLLEARAKIEKLQKFSFSQILQMIEQGDVVPDHARALRQYIDEEIKSIDEKVG